MKNNNDNNAYSTESLLLRAKQIIGGQEEIKEPVLCSLLTGGACPLLKSMLESMKNK